MNTETINKEDLLLKAVISSIEAGKAIMEVYASDFSVEFKSDSSPLTVADKRSHEIIKERLSQISGPWIPLLSEEGRDIPFEERKDWEYLWVVDPLDGTKEFVKRNGEFTVNIALVHKGRPVMGVIYVPVKDVLYFADEGLGAYKLQKAGEEIAKLPDVNPVIPAKAGIRKKVLGSIFKAASKLPLSKEEARPFTVIGSRSHMSKETEEFINDLKSKHGDVEILSAGSSLKLCLIAEGKADVYPRFAPTMEWDIAAGQAIVEGAGGRVLDVGTYVPMKYNKKNLLNPWFLAEMNAEKLNCSINKED